MVGVLCGHQWRSCARIVVALAAWASLMPSSGRTQSLFNLVPAAPAQEEQPAAQPAPAQPPVAEAAPARRAASQRRPSGRHARSADAARDGERDTRREAAEDAPKDGQQGGLGVRINANTIAVMSGDLDATSTAAANDMSAVLDDGDDLRILPVIGKGGGQTIRDVRFMKGIDLGITQSNLLNDFKRSGEIGPLGDKIVYVGKLFNEEIHVMVRADSRITGLEQLSGQRVNFGDIGSGTQLTARDVFARLGVKAQEVNLDQAEAVRELKSGAIAATVLIVGKPSAAIAKLAADGVRLLPVPYAKQLQNDYLPSSLGAQDYPGIIEPAAPVDTVAVGAVLIAYNWPRGSERYRRIAKFVAAFFPRLANFQTPPRHPKWREVNLAAVLPGWTRFEAAQVWLQHVRDQTQAGLRQFDGSPAARDAPGADGDGLSREERDRLFQEFVKWNQARERR